MLPSACDVISLRTAVLAPLLEADAVRKAVQTLALASDLEIDSGAETEAPPGIPGRPPKPELVPHNQLPQRTLTTIEGRAALVHSVAHIELNAIDLALDIVWRFPGMPEAFYRDWVGVAKEEAKHFTLLRDHLVSLGFDYGAFQAHNGLWEMAERTKDDLLARLALVPRTLEARGLDASRCCASACGAPATTALPRFWMSSLPMRSATSQSATAGTGMCAPSAG
jgi:uncharacterized ferritin-like protein (DUF455 family)